MSAKIVLYKNEPWVINDQRNAENCHKLGYADPCGEHVTCGGVNYIECKKSCDSSGDSGGSGSKCAAGKYTASIICTYNGLDSDNNPTFKCNINVPCPIQHIEIMGRDNIGQDKVVYQNGQGGAKTEILKNYQIPGNGGIGKCYFFGRPEGGFGVDQKLTPNGISGTIDNSTPTTTYGCSYEVEVKW